VWTTVVLDWLQVFLERRAATPIQADLLALAVEEARDQVANQPAGLVAGELPGLTYLAAGGAGHPPLALAGCCLCVYLGADVLDNVADRELPPRWAAHGPAQATLTGSTLLAAFALDALGELEASVPVRAVVERALAGALIEMSAGQADDLASEGRDDVTLDACEGILLGKSGAQAAFFARAGAIVAGASVDVYEAYARFGRSLGAAGQLASDCGDLFSDDGEVSRDLAAGKRTLPIVYALAVLPPDGRETLLGHLDAAPADPNRAGAARQMMLDAGALQYGALRVEVYRARALAALDTAKPLGHVAPTLQRLAAATSLLRPGATLPDATEDTPRPANRDGPSP